jgi:ferredoxin
MIGSKIQKMPGVEVKVTDACIGCGTCLKNICFVDATYMKNNRAEISKECRGCGRCVDVCPQNARTLTIKDKNFVLKSIKQIENVIDVS